MKSVSDYFLSLRGCIVPSILLILLVLAESCNSQPVTSEAGQTTPADSTFSDAETPAIMGQTLPEDFNAFFEKFHSDTVFQLAHINFPLEGLPNAQGDSDTIAPERYFWQRDGWKIHRPFTDPGNSFQQWFEMKGDRIIEHWILLRGSDLYIYRRFAKIDNDWFLIYYQGLRKTKR